MIILIIMLMQKYLQNPKNTKFNDKQLFQITNWNTRAKNFLEWTSGSMQMKFASTIGQDNMPTAKPTSDRTRVRKYKPANEQTCFGKLWKLQIGIFKSSN